MAESCPFRNEHSTYIIIETRRPYGRSPGDCTTCLFLRNKVTWCNTKQGTISERGQLRQTAFVLEWG
ncbi:unnamed protein product [Mycena citricolor]|uniref:Uncharacterized protein n=1 Tax=Mycena citricolor TaxID=2018698 RepID=A0AAD2Q4W9_9AGAR|nr:unnamed protein product [Mycena citricolor]